MERVNPAFYTDSYKISHPRMYPKGTTELMNYTESRGSQALGGADVPITWAGYQIFVRNLAKMTMTHEDNKEARELYKEHFLGADFYPYDDFDYMIRKYDGKFPVEIKSAPEGLTIPSHNVLVTTRSTDERLFWMPSFLETMNLCASWYGPTVATNDVAIAKIIYKYLALTSDNPDALFMSRNHDFGFRGATSLESACIAGAVHTLISAGSDTVAAIDYAKKMYDYKGMPAFSIPASEHSVTTAHGKALEHLIVDKSLNNFPGAPLVANVLDSYDMENFVDNIIGKQYKQAIIDSGKVYVCRPDSGNALINVIYILKSLEKNFGVTVNSKGYKVLNHTAVINGDGNDAEQIQKICHLVKDQGFSLDNVAFGTGGGIHQKGLDRDTYRFATKLCLEKINGQYQAVYKDPVTDHGKKSRGGDLDLVRFGHGYQTIDRLDKSNPACKEESVLQTTYLNGETPNLATFEQVRERIMHTIKQSYEANVQESVTV